MELDPDDDPQAAVDAASPGETVVADSATTHELAEPLAVTTPGVTLRGFSLALAPGANCNVVELRADGVRFADFRVDGRKTEQDDDYTDSGVVVRNAERVAVERGRVVDVDRHGVLVGPADPANRSADKHEALDAHRAADVAVRDVTVADPRRDGVSVQGFNVSGVTVEGCRVTGSRDRGGVEVKDGASGVTVTNCRVADCVYGYAVQDHGHYGVDGVTFAANAAADCETLVDAQTSLEHANVTVLGNRGRRVGGDGHGGEGGVFVHRVAGLVVANNHLADVGAAGVRVVDCPDAQVTGNRVEGADGPGLELEDAPGAVVGDNACLDGGDDGVVYRATGGRVAGAQVTNNRCARNDGCGLRVAESGGEVDDYLLALNGVRENEGEPLANGATGTGVVIGNLR